MLQVTGQLEPAAPGRAVPTGVGSNDDEYDDLSSEDFSNSESDDEADEGTPSGSVGTPNGASARPAGRPGRGRPPKRTVIAEEDSDDGEDDLDELEDDDEEEEEDDDVASDPSHTGRARSRKSDLGRLVAKKAAFKLVKGTPPPEAQTLYEKLLSYRENPETGAEVRGGKICRGGIGVATPVLSPALTLCAPFGGVGRSSWSSSDTRRTSTPTGCRGPSWYGRRHATFLFCRIFQLTMTSVFVWLLLRAQEADRGGKGRVQRFLSKVHESGSPIR